jgi:uncharacterized glyoxalase superfamily protein PhnB
MNQDANYIPEGRSTICPFLVVDNINIQIGFLKDVFNAELVDQLVDELGNIRHCELKIGDVVLMIGPSNTDYPARKSLNYVYVPDADNVFNKAIENGAKSFMEPSSKFYGIRDGAFTDPNGNEWWIAAQIEKLSGEEIQKRMKEN